jgi:hypothetical protein
MINYDPLENLIEAARAVSAGEPEATARLQDALDDLDEAEADAQADAQMRVIERARDEYLGSADGDIEIDEAPLIAPADEGVWVNAWVWVPDSG